MRLGSLLILFALGVAACGDEGAAPPGLDQAVVLDEGTGDLPPGGDACPITCDCPDGGSDAHCMP